ncbi:putative lipoprotein [Psychromonas sp. CNPT3]|uniref:Ig-like domain-containing protein n=1 Tax=Psychromonas sp. CNPT3 TaxID=314282 RepID=UPI00006E480E|nr:Ig-like domain-containing protein [Psychromonas sp. CNPT3]AGH81273.1 putative lipoprotein [Psychromonas sp. CNPT3]
MKKYIFACLCAFSILLTGCNNGDTSLLSAPTQTSQTKIKLVVTPKNTILPAGFTRQKEAKVELISDSVLDVTGEYDLIWSSSDVSVATVNTKGLVTTIKEGTSVITATSQHEGKIFSDSGNVKVTNSVVESGSLTINIDGNTADGQSVILGIPTQLEVKAHFTDNSTLSSLSSEDDATYLSWTTNNANATITEEGMLHTTGIAPGTEIILTTEGKGKLEGEVDTITVIISDEVVVAGSLIINIDGDSSDGQSVILGIPTQLEVKATMSDSTLSTLDGEDDSTYINWNTNNTNATITDEGMLYTTGIIPGTEILITATGKRTLNGESDTIRVIISDEIIMAGSLMINIDGDSSDGQSVILGIPTQLEIKATLSDSTLSTLDGDDDTAYIYWSTDNSNATITDEGMLHTTSIPTGTEIVITATGKGTLKGEVDTITVIISDEIVTVNSLIIKIDGDSSDDQFLDIDTPTQLEVEAELSDSMLSTLDGDDDIFYLNWSTNDPKATITYEGMLNASGIEPGSTLLITATGKGTLANEIDTITVRVGNPISTVTWGGEAYGYGGDSSSVQKELHHIVSISVSGGAFAAITEDDNVVTWGDETLGGDSDLVQDKLQNIVSISGTNYAFAAITKNASVVTWGSADYGGSAPTGLPKIAAISASYGAFAAITEDGNVVTWGASRYGGDGGSVLSELHNIVSISATDHAFAAITENGDVVTWGNPNSGGNSTSVKDSLHHIKFISASGRAFAAITEDDDVVTWGSADYGGSAPIGLPKIAAISATDYAFAIITEDGNVVTWGTPRYGGDSSSVQTELHHIVSISASSGAFAAITEDGNVVTWGAFRYGGDSGLVLSELHNIVSISATDHAFAAITENGDVVTWGNDDDGGDSSFVQEKLHNVKSITGNDRAFAAILLPD